MKIIKKNKGFTLVELIVVIAIIGILAAVLIPTISSYVDRAKDSAALQEAETVETAYLTWQIDRVDLVSPEDPDDPDPKNDFRAYLTNMKVLSGGQVIVEAVPGDDLDTEIGFGESFIFTATNSRQVRFDYDDATQKLTMTVLDE